MVLNGWIEVLIEIACDKKEKKIKKPFFFRGNSEAKNEN